MKVTAVLDRIEDGIAVLIAEEFEAEFKVPEELIDEEYTKGEILTIDLGTNGECIIS